MVVSALFRFRLCMSLLFSLILSQNSFSQQNKVLILAEKVIYKNVGLAFFAKSPVKYFIETTFEIDLFLKSLSYLKVNPTIKKQYKL